MQVCMWRPRVDIHTRKSYVSDCHGISIHTAHRAIGYIDMCCLRRLARVWGIIWGNPLSGVIFCIVVSVTIAMFRIWQERDTCHQRCMLPSLLVFSVSPVIGSRCARRFAFVHFLSHLEMPRPYCCLHVLKEHGSNAFLNWQSLSSLFCSKGWD